MNDHPTQIRRAVARCGGGVTLAASVMLAGACGGTTPAVEPGRGLARETAGEQMTLSVDPSLVPVVDPCGAGEVPVRVSSGWSCDKPWRTEGAPPTGMAGGDLAGTYPNPTLATGSVVRSLNGLHDAVGLEGGRNVQIVAGVGKLTVVADDAHAALGLGLVEEDHGLGLDTSCAKGQILARSEVGWSCAELPSVPGELPPTGAAGGDLSGAYPNPTIAAGKTVRSLNGLTDAVTVVGGSNVNVQASSGVLTISAATVVPAQGFGLTMHGTALGLDDGCKLGEVLTRSSTGWACTAPPAALPPSGPAGGDLAGTYPNPVLAPGHAVKSLNGLGDALTLQGGDNVTVSQTAPHTLTISTAPPTSLPPSGPAGGVLTGSYPSPGLASGAAVRALNGLTDNLTLKGGTGVAVSTSGSTILIDATGGTAVKDVTSANMATVSVADEDLIRIDDLLPLSQDYAPLWRNRTKIFGGGFSGSGAQTVKLGIGTTVTGSRFADVKLYGSQVTFVNCAFNGAIEFPTNSTAIGSTFTNVTSQVNAGLSVISSTIKGSTFSGVEVVSASAVDTTSIGYVGRFGDNTVTSSLVSPGSDAVVSGNKFTSSKVALSSSIGGLVQVVGNSFFNLYTGATAQVSIDGSGSNYRSYLLASNSFMLQSGDPQAIEVTGTPSGYFQVLHITGNSFLKPAKAISHNGGMQTLVSDSVLKSTLLGVSTGGAVVVQGTASF